MRMFCIFICLMFLMCSGLIIIKQVKQNQEDIKFLNAQVIALKLSPVQIDIDTIEKREK